MFLNKKQTPSSPYLDKYWPRIFSNSNCLYLCMDIIWQNQAKRKTFQSGSFENSLCFNDASILSMTKVSHEICNALWKRVVCLKVGNRFSQYIIPCKICFSNFFQFGVPSIWRVPKPGMYIITLQLILCTKVEEGKKITNNPNFHQNTLDLNGNSTYLFYIILAPLPPSFVKWNWAFMKNQKLN